MDAVDRRVATTLYDAAAHAYAYRPTVDEGYDPDLCATCQRVRPVAGGTVCADCADHAPVAS